MASSPGRVCVGLISGTSADAAEAAVCRIRGSGPHVALQLLAHVSDPFEAALTARIQKANSAREVCELDALLGERFGKVALRAIAAAHLKPKDIRAIGSHGQTLAHLPPGAAAFASSLQIGEAAVIAERTGIGVVSDFRARDLAAGGQGAPLVPYFDWAVFRAPRRARGFQNFGGIANVSVVRARLEDTVAFDTGPGNMMLDAFSRRATGGQASCDQDGSLSRRGKVLPSLLDELCRHPFLEQPPPRSAGREQFGEGWVDPLWERFSRQPFDLIATALAFTVEATARAYERWILPEHSLEAVYLSGGGARNPALVDALVRRLPQVSFRPLAELGFPEAAKEAACFALLAHEFLEGRPANIRHVTGARRAVVLGKWSPK